MAQEIDLKSLFETFYNNITPLFLFGNNRSGTTLLYNIMPFHPGIFKLSKSTYFVPQFWNNRKKLNDKVLSKIYRSSPKYGHYCISPEMQNIISDCYHHFDLLLKKKDPAQLFAFFAFTEYIMAGNTSIGHSFWAEKTNSHIFYYKMLKKWFPKTKFILNFREPKANAASVISAYKRKGLNEREQRTTHTAAISWVIWNTYIDQIKTEFPNDSYLVSYEKLTSSPVSEIADLFEFLSLAPLPEEKLVGFVDSLGAIKPSNIGIERKQGIDTCSTEKWRSLLSPYQKNIIELITYKLAKKYNFTESLAEPTLIDYLTCYKEDSLFDYFHRLLWFGVDKAGLWKYVLRYVQD